MIFLIICLIILYVLIGIILTLAWVDVDKNKEATNMVCVMIWPMLLVIFLIGFFEAVLDDLAASFRNRKR